MDVLTLTATPIRAPSPSHVGGARYVRHRDAPGAPPRAHYVSEYDEALIRRAILREVDRGGQVFYVHNRVQDIHDVADRLAEVVPEVTVAVGHGQMAEGDLAQVMLGFAQGEYDVLLSTTIIESGLDIPNVNTIIIDRADTLGLAQLYQLRGRVGRGSNRAYAYLFYKEPLTDIARQRLRTIREATGWGPVPRGDARPGDRGAGRSGRRAARHIAAIGFDSTPPPGKGRRRAARRERDTVDAMRRAQHAMATARALEAGASIDLPSPPSSPRISCPTRSCGCAFYRRMARVESEEVERLEQELRDRFGVIAEPVEGLLYVLRVRTLAGPRGSRGEPRREPHHVGVPVPLTAEAAARMGRSSRRHRPLEPRLAGPRPTGASNSWTSSATSQTSARAPPRALGADSNKRRREDHGLNGWNGFTDNNSQLIVLGAAKAAASVCSTRTHSCGHRRRNPAAAAEGRRAPGGRRGR